MYSGHLTWVGSVDLAVEQSVCGAVADVQASTETISPAVHCLKASRRTFVLANLIWVGIVDLAIAQK